MSEENKTVEKDEQLEKVVGGNYHQDFQKVTLEIGYYKNGSSYYYCSTCGEKLYDSIVKVKHYLLLDGLLYLKKASEVVFAGVLASCEKVANEDVPTIVTD